MKVEWLPHGVDISVFYPRHRLTARHGFGQRIGARTPKGKWLSVPDDALFIGIVATNQIRKDWALGVQTVAELAKERNVMLWVHTDMLERHWSIPALLNDYGLSDKTVVTTVPLTDEQMSWCYSACDVTLGIGSGEGFGFPIFESMACGTPCIHGNYGGAAEHLVGLDKILPVAYRMETPYNCVRPVFESRDWEYSVRAYALDKKDGHSLLPPELDWNNLWPRWAEWLTAGVTA